MLPAKEMEKISASLSCLNETELDEFSNKVNIGNNKNGEEGIFATINKALKNMNDDEFEKFSQIIERAVISNNIH